MLNLVMGEAARRGLTDSRSNLGVLQQAAQDYRALFQHQVLAAQQLEHRFLLSRVERQPRGGDVGDEAVEHLVRGERGLARLW